VEFLRQNAKKVSLTAPGGTLHGTWTSDASITTSDSRLKTNISPLMKSLQHDWFTQLEPVSFKMTRGPEAKYVRYGFVAQEVEKMFPDLVREDAGGYKAVIYQDFIALLTTSMRRLHEDSLEQRAITSRLEERVELEANRSTHLEERVIALEAYIKAREPDDSLRHIDEIKKFLAELGLTNHTVARLRQLLD